MKFKQFLYKVSLIFPMAIMSMGCNSDIFDFLGTEEGEKVSVNLNISVIPMQNTDGTRAGGLDVRNANVVQDMWIVEYNDNDNRIGTPSYITGSQLTQSNQDSRATVVLIVRPETAEVKYKLYCVANTHDASLGEKFKECETISQLKEVCMNLESVNAASQVADTDILLSGVADVEKDTEELECNLKYNMARLSVTVNNVSTGDKAVEINSVTLCNVPTGVAMFDCLYEEGDACAVNQTVTNLKSDLCNGESQLAFEYVLPRNMRGQNGSTDVKKKNIDAPQDASYLWIEAKDTEGKEIGYKFYLGKDMVKDFNVEPGYHYNLPIKITGEIDVANDSRVEYLASDFTGEELPESNCYIINPASSGEQTYYSIPIVNRINTFWGSDEGESSNVLADNTEWEAEVIWQDCNADMFEFTDKGGAVKNPHFTNGKGSDKYLYFRPLAGVNGNVLIGVKKKGATETDGYLWSWHLWITDYNPSQMAGFEGADKTKYVLGDVGNGEMLQVPQNGTVWYMMDRNLGAKKAKPSSDNNYIAMHAKDIDISDVVGMYYQYGRKDPFPAPYNTYNCNSNIYSYDSSGNRVPAKIIYSENVAKSRKESVKYPNKFFSEGSGSVYEWLKDEDSEISTNWMKPKSMDEDIFDPTPMGFSLPGQDDMDIFTSYKIESNLNNTDYYKGYWFVVENGAIITTYRIYKNNSHIYFPFAGIAVTYNESGSTNLLRITLENDRSTQIGSFLRLKDNVHPYYLFYGVRAALNLSNGILSSYSGAGSALQIRCIKK